MKINNLASISHTKNGLGICKTKKHFQKRNFQQKILINLSRWEYLMKDDFLKNERKKITSLNQW